MRGLARAFRIAYALPEIFQLGIVVPDVPAACARLEEEGVPPFFIAHGAPASWIEHGEAKAFSGQLAWSYREGIQIEHLGPGTGSDFYRKDLDPQGRPVLQHLGFPVPDVAAATKRLTDAGMPLVVRGKLLFGPIVCHWDYVDALKEVGYYIEIYRFSLFGATLILPPHLIRALGQLEKWSGIRSIGA